MSDDGPLGGPSTDEDLSLPKATVQKLISELLPKDIVCSKDTRDLIIECCVEFIHMVSTEANEICEQESKKTIAPEHILSALKKLGFDAFRTEVEEVLNDHKIQQKEREKRSNKFDKQGMTDEELLRKQEELFAAAKARYDSARSLEDPMQSG